MQGIVAAFMPGQEYGNAVVDLLWGDVGPTARLPITFPARENQWGFAEAQWPGVNDHSAYSERLEVGYRYYDAHGEVPAFLFGYGIGYTTFAYSNLTASRSEVSFTLRNTGQRSGTEVAQLYLGFPSEAGEPPKQLKGFHAATLAAGVAAEVAFPLDARAVSICDVGTHGWAVQKGAFTAYVGANSRDIRLTGAFTI